MPLIDHEDILIADEPDDFARAVVELYESEELWNRLSKNGIKKTQAHYSISSVRKRLNRLLSDKHIRPPPGRGLRTLNSKISSGPIKIGRAHVLTPVTSASRMP